MTNINQHMNIRTMISTAAKSGNHINAEEKKQIIQKLGPAGGRLFEQLTADGDLTSNDLKAIADLVKRKTNATFLQANYQHILRNLGWLTADSPKRISVGNTQKADLKNIGKKSAEIYKASQKTSKNQKLTTIKIRGKKYEIYSWVATIGKALGIIVDSVGNVAKWAEKPAKRLMDAMEGKSPREQKSIGWAAALNPFKFIAESFKPIDGKPMTRQDRKHLKKCNSVIPGLNTILKWFFPPETK